MLVDIDLSVGRFAADLKHKSPVLIGHGSSRTVGSVHQVSDRDRSRVVASRCLAARGNFPGIVGNSRIQLEIQGRVGNCSERGK